MKGAVKSEDRALELAAGRQYPEGTLIQEASEEQMQRNFRLIARLTQEMVFMSEQHLARKLEELLDYYDKLIRVG